MRDYIKVPSWASLDNISSCFLNLFIEDAELIDNQKISMDSLRSYYKNNGDAFIATINELSMRGFEFFSLKPNNILPKMTYSQSEEYIYSIYNKDKYLGINFDKLGLGNFISTFKVNEDMFFNYIPIKGFKTLNSNVEMEIIKQEFLKNGFLIKWIGAGGETFNKINEKYEETYIKEWDLRNQSIEIYFNENKYRYFRGFCHSRGIKKTSEIMPSHIEAFAMLRGVGEVKVKEVMDRLSNSYLVEMFLNNDNSVFDILFQEIKKIPEQYTINNCFYESKYGSFWRFCNQSGIIFVKDIKKYDIEKFSKFSGVGKVKLVDVLNRIMEVNAPKENFIIEDSFDDMINYEIKLNKLFMEIENIPEQYIIDDCFNGGKYNLFRKFCNENNIKKVKDIKHKDLERFSKVRGVGNVKVEDTINRMLEISSLYNGDLQYKKFVLKNDLYKFVKDFSLVELFSILDKDYNGKDFVIKDVQGQYISVFADSTDVLLINDCLNFINSLLAPNEIAPMITKGLTGREKFVLESRYVRSMTLQDIADIKNISRERVRQIEKKAIRKIDRNLKITNFKMSLRIILKDKKYILIKEISDLIDEKHSFLLGIFTSGKINGIGYFEPLSLLYAYVENGFGQVLDRLESFIISLPEIFLLEDYIETIENLLETNFDMSFGLEEIDKILGYYGYKNYGVYYSSRTLHVVDILEILIRDYFIEPTRIDEDNVKKIKTMSKERFNFDLDSSIRSIEARIRDIEDVILVDSRTFCHIANLDYDETIIDYMEIYLSKYFKDYQIINAEQLYIENKYKCQNKGINNKMVLYSLIKYYFDDKYTMGMGNSLDIHRDDKTIVMSREDRVIEYLANKGGKSTRSEILKAFGWRASKLDDTIAKSDKLLAWDSDEVILFEMMKIDEEIKERIRLLLKELMVDGFTTSSVIFEEMLFDPELNQFLRENNIDNYRKLSLLIKELYKEVNGHVNFLYIEGTKYKNIYDVIKGELKGITSRQEIQELVSKYGYSSATISITIDNLIKEGAYLELSQYELISSGEFFISKDDLENVIKDIEKRINGREYISLSNLKGYRATLPDIGYKWNPYLIKTVLEGNGFRSINRRSGDYRYDKVIMVKEDSKILTFEDLVYFILKEEYSGNLHETKVYDYLAKVGILREQEDLMNKKLPYEIYQSEKIHIDSIGRIELV